MLTNESRHNSVAVNSLGFEEDKHVCTWIQVPVVHVLESSVFQFKFLSLNTCIIVPQASGTYIQVQLVHVYTSLQAPYVIYFSFNKIMYYSVGGIYIFFIIKKIW